MNKLILSLEQEFNGYEKRSQIIEHILELYLLVEKPLPQKMQLFIKELNPHLSPHQLLNKLYFYCDGAIRKIVRWHFKRKKENFILDPDIHKKQNR